MRNSFDENHPFLALIYGYIGLLYCNWTKYEQSENYFINSININKKILE